MTRLFARPIGFLPLLLLASVALQSGIALAAEPKAAELQYTEIAPASWDAALREVTGMKGKQAATIGFPVKERRPLLAVSSTPQPAGLYRVRLTVRPSHTSNAVAWEAGLDARLGDKAAPQRIEALRFTRVHEPEIKTFDLVHTGTGPLTVRLDAAVDAEVMEKFITRAKMAGGIGPAEKDPAAKQGSSEVDDLLGELTVGLSPKTHFYYLIDKVEVAPLSHSAQVTEVYVDKVRYSPGDKLQGEVTLTRVGKSPAQGKLTIYLEHGVQEREQVGQLEVELKGNAEKFTFEVPLPQRELGHAIVVQYASADGKDHSQGAEYFNIAQNFQRVLISGSPYGQGSTAMHDPEQIAALYRKHRSNYSNMQEVFAWAEEDMVEMSPDTDVWYSGQTCYRIYKKGLQEWIRQGQKQGWAWTTYGKFIMSGYLGWKTAWDYPRDHRAQFVFPVGMWETIDVHTLDRFRYKEFVPYSPTLQTDGLLNGWWQSFLPINPDPTPRMVRIAAEEAIRSTEMFGWDGIRWDGQMRSGGQTNAQGEYDYDAARRTETLVRYFKDIVATKYPHYGHGYNYLFTQDKPSYDWAYEDFEMDELCEGGGLIMNESIRNGTNVPFTWHAANLQVEGDLCRERGGYFLCIPTDATSERDKYIELMLYFAGGARPYVAPFPILNRYGTRYSQYTLDETLRRLVKPEEILAPVGKTDLWWDPFVYETQPQPEHAPAGGGVRRQLVVNLLNIPRDAKPHASTSGPISPDVGMALSEGSAPVEFALQLPETHRAVQARFIDPFTLEVSPATISKGRVQIPPVSIWKVLILDLDCDAKAPALADKFGPPKTFLVPRPGLKQQRYEMVRLDPLAPLEVAEAEYRKMPGSGVAEQTNDDAALAKLSPAERDAKLLAQRKLPDNQAENYLKQWWKGGSLGGDLELQKKPSQAALKLQRNGKLDIFLARGAFDHRLRLPEALAQLGTFSLQEAKLIGGRTDYGLYNRLSLADLPKKDLLIYADIPHSAIGVKDSYALVDYVRAGGGILFTGGNYSFGKGGYMWTVLDRELLPVQTVETVDVRYAAQPLPLEAGPDFKELGVKTDFSAKPVLWVYNQVALRPEAKVKVFLKSGNRPILVGWQLGEGRVACLLATQMGQSAEGSQAFFDWQAWPEVTAAVLKWLAPNAGEVTPFAGLPETELAALQKQLGTGSADDQVSQLLDDVVGGSGVDLNSGEKGDARLAPRPLAEKELAERVNLLNKLFAGTQQPPAKVLAHQLATVSNLPEEMVDRILAALAVQQKPDQPALLKAAQACLAHRDAEIKGHGYELLALASDKSLVPIVLAGPSTELPDANPYRCLAIARYTGPELKSYATSRLTAWAQEAERNKLRYTGGEDWSIGLPKQPALESQKLLEQVALLAYMAEQEPQQYAGQFSKEWLLISHYMDYCDLTISSKYASFRDSSPAQQTVSKREIAVIADLKQDFARMQQVTRPLLEKLLAAEPKATGAGLRQVEYQVEAHDAIKLLAALPVETSRLILQQLTESQQPLLAAFCRARLAE